jgi:hypothetical protein
MIFLLINARQLSIDTEPQTLAMIGAVSVPPSDSDAMQPTPHKIHLRGLDNLSSSDVEAFASEHFSGAKLDKVEWIDDTSANLLYETPTLAMEALMAFADADIGDISQIPPLRMIPAKPVPSHPETQLHIRLAVAGDRKQAGARERSRFYLFNPDHDPAERRKRGGYGRRGERRYRDRDEGNYRDRDSGEPFDASLYDDDEITRAVRASKSHGSRGSRSSVSSGEYQGQGVRKARSSGRSVRELFPDRVARRRRDGGRLRDRSASPARENPEALVPDQLKSRLRNANLSGAANRLQAQMIKARLKEASIEPKELFPQKSTINHRRSDAFDATDAAADLFAARMPVPFLDGSGEVPPRKRDLISRITKPSSVDHGPLESSSDQNGFNIRGNAGQQQPIGISIKGMALGAEPSVKELFPHKTGLNAGKELFSEKLEGRGGRRQRAEDMFY